MNRKESPRFSIDWFKPLVMILSAAVFIAGCKSSVVQPGQQDRAVVVPQLEERRALVRHMDVGQVGQGEEGEIEGEYTAEELIFHVALQEDVTVGPVDRAAHMAHQDGQGG